MPAHEASDETIAAARPRERVDCAEASRPCPWVACRWHLADTTVTRQGDLIVLGQRIRRNADPAEVEAATEQISEAVAALSDSCALDVIEASIDGGTLHGVGDAYRATRERVRQIERRALGRLNKPAGYLRREF